MISTALAGKLLLLIFALLFIFHILVLCGVIPFNIVWAGKIKSRKELIIPEIVSLSVLCLATVIVALKTGDLNFIESPTVINAGMWVLFAFFCLNTAGNLTAKNPFEKYGFGLLTFLIALLALRLALA